MRKHLYTDLMYANGITNAINRRKFALIATDSLAFGSIRKHPYMLSLKFDIW